MTKEEFITECSKLDIIITEKIYDKFSKYYEYLVTNNKKFNLTAILEENSVFLKHFYDSLTIVKTGLLTKNISLLDFGTGAGFPGMVVAILFDKVRVTLLESNGKKCQFLRELSNLLNLNNVTVINDRCEKYAKENRELYDIVTCRAVSSLSVISELSSSLVKKNGYMIFLKSSYEEEYFEAKKLIIKLGFELDKIINFQLPIEKSKRNIIIFKKINETPEEFPRSYSVISKHNKKRINNMLTS